MADTEGLVDVLKFMLRPRPVHEVAGGSAGDRVEVTDAEAGRGSAVIVRGWSGGEVVVRSAKVAKVVVHGCTNTRVVIESTIISGCVEIISSADVVVDAHSLHVAAHTVTVDMSQRVRLHLSPLWAKTVQRATVIAGSSTDVALVLGPDGADPYAIPDSLNAGDDETHFQIATHRAKDADGNWILYSEPVVREGIGHVTTAARLDSDTARLARNKERLDALMSGAIDTLGPDTRFPEPKPRPAVPARPSARPPARTVPPRAVPPRASADASAPPDAPHAPPSSLADAISSFSTSALKPTTTRVTTVANILGGDTTAAAAAYGHADTDDVAEYEDEPEVLDAKIAALAALVGAASRAVAFTGAGVSTSAEIPDYRGPNGVWTNLAKGIRVTAKISLDQAVPTPAHMALAAMLDDDAVPLTHIVSTNLDGLHRRSGVPAAALSELHGSAYLERCGVCGAEYERAFDCTARGTRADHKTGRICDDVNCGGELLDSIINFGEMLPEDQYASAHAAASDADLAIVLGTSMRVSPACDLPRLTYTKPGGKMVIVNLQKTPFDHAAALRIFARTDVVMAKLAEHLGIAIPDGASTIDAAVASLVASASASADPVPA